MYSVKPIAIAKTPFSQKFGIPRQAGLVAFPATINLLPPFHCYQAVEGLEQVSHLWISFVFHQHVDKEPQLQVRPPRLGGNRKLGVFATRSSFRPNSLGLSLVKLEKIEQTEQGIVLHVLGLDVLDGTPIVDIKPYLPYADSINEAFNHVAPDAPSPRLTVLWQAQALAVLSNQWQDKSTTYKHYIEQIIALDPRPAYKQKQSIGEYAMQLFGLDIHWCMQSNTTALVTACIDCKNT